MTNRTSFQSAAKKMATFGYKLQLFKKENAQTLPLKRVGSGIKKF